MDGVAVHRLPFRSALHHLHGGEPERRTSYLWDIPTRQRMTESPEAPPERKTRGVISIGLLAGVPILLLALWGIGGLNEQSIPGLPVVPVQTLWRLPLQLGIRDTAWALVGGFAHHF